MQFRLLENKGTPKWEISRWTYSPEKKRALKEALGSFPCYYSMVPHPILDKCTTQEKAEVLEWWRVTSEAVNRERVRSQITRQRWPHSFGQICGLNKLSPDVAMPPISRCC